MIGNVVRYNFIALNDPRIVSEYFDYAIVIDVNNENNTAKILPITKEYGKDSIESFCIGEIPGLVEVKNEGFVHNKQYVHFDKILDVGLDEISRVHVQDTYGNLTKGENGEPIYVALSPQQTKIVLDKYGIYEKGEERSLVNLILKTDASYMLNEKRSHLPESKKLCSVDMDKYREYNFDDYRVIVFFIDGKRYSAVLEHTGNRDVKYRNDELLKVVNV